jgi:hypothetical protein
VPNLDACHRCGRVQGPTKSHGIGAVVTLDDGCQGSSPILLHSLPSTSEKRRCPYQRGPQLAKAQSPVIAPLRGTRVPNLDACHRCGRATALVPCVATHRHGSRTPTSLAPASRQNVRVRGRVLGPTQGVQMPSLNYHPGTKSRRLFRATPLFPFPSRQVWENPPVTRGGQGLVSRDCLVNVCPWTWPCRCPWTNLDA